MWYGFTVLGLHGVPLVLAALGLSALVGWPQWKAGIKARPRRTLFTWALYIILGFAMIIADRMVKGGIGLGGR